MTRTNVPGNLTNPPPPVTKGTLSSADRLPLDRFFY
jgi:hypothetical protein